MKTERPKEFDERLVAHIPLLERIAARYCHPRYREDIVQDTIAVALARWRTFRPDGSFHKWLRWRLMSVYTNGREKLSEIAIDKDDVRMDTLIFPAGQDNTVYAAQVMDAIPKNRRHVMGRIALGDTPKEASDALGVSRQRGHQLIADARKRIAHMRDDK